MIYFVVSFALGIIFESVLGGWGWPFSLLVAVISAFLFLYLKKENAFFGKTVLLVGLAFCLGILRMNFAQVSPDQNLYQLVGEKVSFEAVISKEPDVRDTSARYIVRPELSSKSLILLVADRFPELRYGDKIKVSGKLELPKNFTGESGEEFDYVSFLAKDQIHFIVYYPQIDPISSAQGGLRGTRRIVSALYSLKSIFIEKISAVVPEPNASLLGGLIFGARQSLGAELLDDFRKVGLIHIVVLSGYNLTVIAAGIFAATSYFGKRNLSFAVSAVAIALFAVMVGLGATVIRAAVMALIAILARFLGRPADALRWLFIAGFLMLLWNPLSLLFDPSFQLSFMATLGLILFSPIVENFIARTWLGRFVTTKFKIREIVSATVAVQLFILPLLIRMSGEVSLVSFLVNPLVLPLVPAVMALGATTGVMGLIPFAGQMLSWPFGVLSYLSSQIIISITELSAKIPLASIPLGALPPLAVILWYIGYGFLYLKLKRKTARLEAEPFERTHS